MLLALPSCKVMLIFQLNLMTIPFINSSPFLLSLQFLSSDLAHNSKSLLEERTHDGHSISICHIKKQSGCLCYK